MSKLKVLHDHREDLVKVLATVTADDSLKFWKDLQRYGVITPEIVDTLASLDQDRLDSKTIVRYLLYVVCESVKVNNTICNKFLEVLEGVKEKNVVQVSKAIAQKIVYLTTSDSEVRPSKENERILLEEDVGNLWEVLINGSYKWEEISILLKLPKAIIEQCKKTSSNNLCLHEALTEWVCGNHKDAKLPTLSHLKHVLASPVVGLPKLSTALDESIITVKQQSRDYNEKGDNDSLILYFQSIDTEVGEGKSTLLEVQVQPSKLANCQWVKDGQTLSDGSHFSGTHTAILVIKKASQETKGKYWCQVQNDSEQLTSSPAKVAVIYPPDKQCLLDMYSFMKEIPEDTWPLVGASKFVDLSLVNTKKFKSSDNSTVYVEMEKIVERKNRVFYSELFHEYQRETLILVEGRPGSGKTTLAHKITKDWAKGEILGDVSKLFLVSLRRNYDKIELFEIFFPSNVQVQLEKIEKSNGDRLCFIFDGYDEYSQKSELNSVINQLIHKQYLPLAMIIVTTRPVGTATLRLKASTTIEILGFTKEQFNKFVSNYPFQELIGTDEGHVIQAELLSYLESCKNVLNMCYLPLNASILCFLYIPLRGQTIPKTETLIYDHFVRAILLRTLRRANPSITLPTLNDLPEKDKLGWNQLCSLAFGMTVECNQILRNAPLALKNSSVWNFLTEDNTVTQAGLEDVHSFLHLTLQEYLAAYHLASLDECQQTKMIILHSGKDHMLTTFKFYCGLVDFRHKMYQFEGITEHGPNSLYMLHCAHETQEQIVCYNALKQLNGSIKITASVLTPADFTVLGYVISNTSNLIESVDINYGLLYEDYNNDRWLNRDFDHTNLLSYNFKSTGAIKNMKIFEDELCASVSYNVKSKNALTRIKEMYNNEDIIDDLFPLYNSINQVLLDSSDIFASSRASPLVFALKQCQTLKKIAFIGNCNSKKSAGIIVECCECFINLVHFTMLGCFSSPGTLVIAEGLHNYKYLQTISLRFFNFSSDGILALSSSLRHLKALKFLLLVKCNINSEGAEKVTSASSHLPLELLDMSMNSIESAGLKYISHNICETCTTLNEIHLMGADIDSSGIEIFAAKLNSSFTLCRLDLSHNDIGWYGAATLAQNLKHCYHLKFLALNDCNLTGCGIALIAETFHMLREISYLFLSRNGTISLHEAYVISDGLSLLESLEELYLSCNDINCECAMILSEGVKNCPNLHTIDLSNNCIGYEGAAAIADSLTCKEIQYIDFSHNRMGEESAGVFVKLVERTRPEKLDLSYNNFGSTGVKYLISGLITYSHPLKLNLLSNNIKPGDIDILNNFHGNSYLQVLFNL